MNREMRSVVERLAEDAFAFMHEADKHVSPKGGHGCPLYRKRWQSLYTAIQKVEGAILREKIKADKEKRK